MMTTCAVRLRPSICTSSLESHHSLLCTQSWRTLSTRTTRHKDDNNAFRSGRGGKPRVSNTMRATRQNDDNNKSRQGRDGRQRTTNTRGALKPWQQRSTRVERDSNPRNSYKATQGRTRTRFNSGKSRDGYETTQSRDKIGSMSETHLVVPEDGEAETAVPLDPEQQRRLERKLVLRDEQEVEQNLQDPLRLADAVVERLRIPDFEAAVRLLRASEASQIRNVVSWNHCIDWLMGQGKLKDAAKIYNEMKKRGHKPDSHTYTIMIRGYAQAVKTKKSVVKDAVAVYNSMFAPNSAVTPSTIHANAIINVCARANDLDSMWSIVARMPQHGAGSADRTTYTTILNAIRDKAQFEFWSENKFSSKDDVNAHSPILDKAVADGKTLWKDVSHRWRRADMVLDEQLVCAMGRLLLLNHRLSDAQQVFDLIETTMRVSIPNRTPSQNLSNLTSGSTEADGADEAIELDPATHSAVRSQESAPGLPLDQTSVYATPGNATLALLLEMCQVNKSLSHLAPSYWHALCTESSGPKVQPDVANVLNYLRILRVLRASSRATDLLCKEWPREVAVCLYTRGAFVMAMSACVRDKKNPNVFATARRLIALMQAKFDEKAMKAHKMSFAMRDVNPALRKQIINRELRASKEKAGLEGLVPHLNVDPKVLGDFIKLAIKTTEGWEEGIRGKDDGTVFCRNPLENHTMVALEIATPVLSDVRFLIKSKVDAFKAAYEEDRDLAKQYETEIRELMMLIRIAIGAFDKVAEISERLKSGSEEVLNTELMAVYRAKQREYNAFMAKMESATGIVVRNSQQFADHEDDRMDFAERPPKTKSWVSERTQAATGRDSSSKEDFSEPFFARPTDEPPARGPASRYSSAAQEKASRRADHTPRGGTWAQRFRERKRASMEVQNASPRGSILQNPKIRSAWRNAAHA